MKYIYVISKSGKPLMPTKRAAHIMKLLKKGMARVLSRKPFVVQMKYNVGEKTQPLHGGTDPGRTNIGNAVVSESKVLYKDHVTTANKDVPLHMADRRAHRQASRRGERLARKRLARKHHTTKDFPDGRILPGCEEPVMLKDMINTEARFNNRKRPEGWITPTVRHLVQTHVNMIRKICSFMPVTDWTIEANRFAFMKMGDGKFMGFDFQNGRMKGFESAKDYVFHLQNGKCACCGNSIDHFHHLVPRSRKGSDLPENLVGLCGSCHEKVHTGQLNLEQIGIHKKYAALSVLNQAIPYIYHELVQIFGEEHVYACSGYDTQTVRTVYSIDKDHPEDAVCIAGMYHTDMITDQTQAFEVRQFRRHNRAIINNQRERTYYLDGKIVARNRSPRFEQKGKALSDLKLTRQEISRLRVKKSTRYYNNRHRIQPGVIFRYNGEQYVITGQITGGKYYRAYGQAKINFPASDCTLIKHNQGLVYI